MKKKSHPLISFVIAVYNAADSLQRCLDSIYQQEIKDWEIILVDGKSTDGTIDIIKENEENIAYWISEEDEGIYDAWNKALDFCKGEWIHFLGADDYLWGPEAIKNVAPVLKQKPNNTNIIYGQVYTVNQKDEIIKRVGKPWEETKVEFLKYMAIPHQGVFHHRSLFRNRSFDATMKYAADYEFLLSEVLQNSPFFVEQIIAAYSLGGISSSPHHSLEMIKEMRDARKKHGIKVPYFEWKYLKAWVKYKLYHFLGKKSALKIVDFMRQLSGRPSLYTGVSNDE